MIQYRSPLSRLPVSPQSRDPPRGQPCHTCLPYRIIPAAFSWSVGQPICAVSGVRRSTSCFLHLDRSARVRPLTRVVLRSLGLIPRCCLRPLPSAIGFSPKPPSSLTPGQILPGLAERLIAVGIPIDRITTAIDVLHSEYAGIGRFWTKEEGATSRLLPHGPERDRLYAESPFAHVHRTREWLLLDLSQTPDSRFGIIPDLKAAGYRHYLVVPIFSHRRLPPRPNLRDPRPGGIWRAGLAGSPVCDADHCGHDRDPLRQSPPRHGAAHLRRRRAPPGHSVRHHPAGPSQPDPLGHPVRGHAGLHPADRHPVA